MDEFFGGEGAQLELAGVCGAIAESNLSILKADQATVADPVFFTGGDSENIRCQVLQGCATIADRFAMPVFSTGHDPFLLPDLGRYSREKGSLLQGLPELAAKYLGECFHR